VTERTTVFSADLHHASCARILTSKIIGGGAFVKKQFAILLSLSASGCNPGAGQLAAYDANNALAVAFTETRIKVARISQSGAQNTTDIVNFLAAKKHVKCDDVRQNEIANVESRLALFKNLENYSKTLANALKPFAKATATVGELQNVLESVEFIVPGSLKPSVIKAGSDLVNATIELGRLTAEQKALSDIRKVAEKSDASVTILARDLTAGLVALDRAAISNLKTWEECEFRLVEWLSKQQNVNAIEVERRFSDFVRTRDAIRSLRGTKAEESPLDKVAELHGSIVRGIYPDDLFAEASRIVALLKTFADQQRKADDALSEIRRQLNSG
jgi:hypothetical protein